MQPYIKRFKSSRFKDNEAFYEKCANKVVEFCEERGIKYHIKFGTRKEYNEKTEVIFKKTCVMPVITE